MAAAVLGIVCESLEKKNNGKDALLFKTKKKKKNLSQQRTITMTCSNLSKKLGKAGHGGSCF